MDKAMLNNEQHFCAAVGKQSLRVLGIGLDHAELSTRYTKNAEGLHARIACKLADSSATGSLQNPPFPDSRVFDR